ncbi:hypothetical protein GDO78_015583 [Eleutherodactylus coqui]|uniref:Uncharacterized protein n=1 Tax=Eleutherodactylus coqui TaxID=57060 RepID=A0A8J6E8I4_ELECQ|nr:hypothetical protein GDO78_015583 [Eleutherodactylus coqui]
MRSLQRLSYPAFWIRFPPCFTPRTRQTTELIIGSGRTPRRCSQCAPAYVRGYISSIHQTCSTFSRWGPEEQLSDTVFTLAVQTSTVHFNSSRRSIRQETDAVYVFLPWQHMGAVASDANRVLCTVPPALDDTLC